MPIHDWTRVARGIVHRFYHSWIDAMSTTGQMWLWAILLPALTLLFQNMCVWPAPRFLGTLAVILLSASVLTFLLFLAAVPASGYFAVTSLVYWKKDGELVGASPWP